MVNNVKMGDRAAPVQSPGEAPEGEESNAALARTTSHLVLLQLFSRLFSFSLNQVLLRSTTPQALGVATMGLEVVRDTGLFLVREGVRGSVVRTRTAKSSSSSPLLAQTLLLPTLLSPLLPLLFTLYASFPPSPLPPHFRLSVTLYALSAVLELIAEQWYLTTLLNWETLTGARVRVEGVAVVLKALGTIATVFVAGSEWALPAYGIGQVAYALALLVGFWSVVSERQSGPVTSPWRLEKVGGKSGKQERFDSEVIGMSWALTKQSVVKQLLTEGDKIAVGRLSNVEDQGGYAVALNYGSLVARILFQPLEEASRLFFSRSLSSPTPATLESTSSLLSLLLLFYTHLSLILILLAPSYTSTLLFHLLGKRWSHPVSSAPVILRSYCAYLPFLAINGITEAFFQSVASPSALSSGNLWMTLSSLTFLVSLITLRSFSTDLGITGEQALIYSNCLNMLVRITFSSLFIRRYFHSHPAARENLSRRKWCPKFITVGVLIAGWVVVRWSEGRERWRSLKGAGEHLGVGVVIGLLCLATIWRAEREAIGRLRRMASKTKEA